MHIHIASGNESIYDIAGEYGISPIKLAEINELELNRNPKAGTELLILIPTRTYNVKRGDTLASIARRFGTEVDYLIAINPELRGRDMLYEGELLAIRYGIPTYGTALTNGYYYRGCTDEQLKRVLPYLNYITVSSAKAAGRDITLLIDDRDILRIAKENNKHPILRIYLTEEQPKEMWEDFFNGAALLAKSRGYRGITLANLSQINSSERCEYILKAKKKLMEYDLTLFTEGEAGMDCPHSEYSDGFILTYDKLHLDDIPSFDEGERAALTLFADGSDSSTAFVDMPAFAFSGGEYIERRDAAEASRRYNGRITQDDLRKIGRIAFDNKEDILYENMANTKARLELVSQLGFMGISFDICRVKISEVMMFYSMFRPVTNTATYEAEGTCPGVDAM